MNQHDETRPPRRSRAPGKDYDLWLAGLGAAALAWDAGRAALGYLTGSSEPAGPAGPARAEAATTDLRRATEQASAEAERATHEAVRYTMERLDLPARSAVNQLARDIDRLGQQVDRIKRLIEEDRPEDPGR